MNAPTFAFISAKGGSGATTVCSEVAKMMRSKGPVVVVDGDLWGRRNMAILFDAVRPLDASRQSAIGMATTSGLTLVELAATYDAAFTINLEEVERLAGSFGDAGCVLADVPMPFSAAVRPFVVRATRFIMVAEPTLLGVASARTMVNELKRFGIPLTRIMALTNCRDGSPVVSRNDIERALEVKVVAELPAQSDRNYTKCLAAFEKTLSAIAGEPQLETLLPSAKTFVQDRRGERRPGANENRSTVLQQNAAQANGKSTASTATVDAHQQLKLDIHESLSNKINLVEASSAHTDAAKFAELRQKIEDAAQHVLSEKAHKHHLTAEEIARIKEEIVNESLGLGPLEDLMSDANVTEIMVNGPQTVYVERGGKIERTTKRFTSEQALRLVIERIIAPLGRRLDESVPMVDARLPDGSRVNAIISPLAIDGASVTIRRFGTRRMTSQDLIEKGSANEEMLDFLRACIEARLNVVISGGTGSGKTTFLNILSSYIPERERIVTIEDAAELCLNQPHVVRLESRPPNLEGRGEIRIRDLVKNSLRMRPDRIVVGECRGGEALDMLQAMNTGHDGSLTTAHANSPRDALSRMETMVMMAGFDLPVRAIREQIASAVDLIIQTARLRDGSRKIISISELVGMEGEVVTMQEIIRFAQHGMDLENKVTGEFQYTGVQPQCLTRFDEYGISYDVRKLSTLASTGTLW